MVEIKFSRVNFLSFYKKDGEVVRLKIPDSWNQECLRLINRNDYTVRLAVTSESPRESSFSTFKSKGGKTGGYIIPSAAILSDENPHAMDSMYCAYNILVADAICKGSLLGDYSLADDGAADAMSRRQIFKKDSFYVITWNKYFPPLNFERDYSLSLCINGILLSVSDEVPSGLPVNFDGDGSGIRLKPLLQPVPTHVLVILTALVPFCKNPFLKFFYLYQVVEYLMGKDLSGRIDDIRGKFQANSQISFVEVREILEKFQDATREKKRINAVLVPECSQTIGAAIALLDAIKIEDAGNTFGERLYRIRNKLFHDYGSMHENGELLAVLCQHFYYYLLERKILA